MELPKLLPDPKCILKRIKMDPSCSKYDVLAEIHMLYSKLCPTFYFNSRRSMYHADMQKPCFIQAVKIDQYENKEHVLLTLSSLVPIFSQQTLVVSTPT